MDIEQLNALIETLKNPGEDGIPETVYDDITSGFTASADASANANAKIEQLEAEKDALLNEFNEYKLRMFDKLMHSPEAQTDAEPAGDADDSEPTTDDLFDDKDDN